MATRLEDLLTQYVSFLKIKGRFRDISYEEKDDKTTKAVAEPFFPEMPKVEAHTVSEKMFVDVIGENSEHIKNESVHFFEMSGLSLEKVVTHFILPDSVAVFVEGKEDSNYITIKDAIQSTIENVSQEQLEHKIGLIFSHHTATPAQIPKQKLSRAQLAEAASELRPTEVKKRDLKISEPRKPIIATPPVTREPVAAPTRPVKPVTTPTKPPVSEEVSVPGITNDERQIIEAIATRPKRKAQSNLLSKSTSFPQDTIRKLLRQLVGKGVLKVQAGWYVLDNKGLSAVEGLISQEPPTEDLKQIPSSKGDSLLSEKETKVLEAIQARPNKKAQSNLLTKPTKLDQNTLKSVLRTLVQKDFLEMKFGWYSLKEGIPLPSSTDEQPITVGQPPQEDQTQLETQIIDTIEAQPKKKLQAKMLAKKLKIPAEKVRETLRSLVTQGQLSEKKGWFTLTKATQSEESYKATTKKVIDAIKARPSGRAQSHLLVKPTGLSKEELRTILKALVKDGRLECKHGWYQPV